jgi:hypothetical protein
MKVLETPESEREAIYEIVRQSLEDADRVIPQEKGFIDQYMIWLRSLVGIIEAGGGARGGTARRHPSKGTRGAPGRFVLLPKDLVTGPAKPCNLNFARPAPAMRAGFPSGR